MGLGPSGAGRKGEDGRLPIRLTQCWNEIQAKAFWPMPQAQALCSPEPLSTCNRVSERAAVDVLELAADGDAVRDAARFDFVAGRDLGNDMRRRIAFDGRVRRENRFGHFAFSEQRFELREPELFRTDAVERRDVAHQNEVTSSIAARLLDRGDV